MPQCLGSYTELYKEKEGASSKYDDISTPLEYLLEMLGARFVEDIVTNDYTASTGSIINCTYKYCKYNKIRYYI